MPKTAKAPKAKSLLVEVLTEELPPKALRTFDLNFYSSVFDELKKLGFVAPTVVPQHFATPRRLAAVIDRVRDKQSEQSVERRGPAVSAGLDASGNPTPALLGFAKSCGVAVETLQRTKDAKGEYFIFRTTKPGEPLERHLAGIVQKALEKLPIPKLMRWGDGDAQFVRPVHGLVMLHGERVVPGTVFGLNSGRRTRGHRFAGKDEIIFKNADEYEARLRKDGMVVANYEARKSQMEKELRSRAARLGASLGAPEEIAFLLDEVTALIEQPSIYLGEFDRAFLEVPQECLVLTMRQNQKYFPLFTKDGRLLSKFLIVSNIKVPSPGEIVAGNKRVLRARLADAKFFYDQDRKTRLEARVPKLAGVVYHGKLGNQLERVKRIQLLAGFIAREIGVDPMPTERAAWLSKADLLTEMVGEFPELQGIMGRDYALHDEEPAQVADAIEAHYRPRFSGDTLPQDNVGAAVALADKLDALAGLFGIGQVPTGDKDPFGLRRAALGVVRILIERSLPLNVMKLSEKAQSGFAGKTSADVSMNLYAFLIDRLRPYLRERACTPDEIDAVLAISPTRLDQILPRLDAVKRFRALPEGLALSAANKRLRNILRQAFPDLHLGADGYETRQSGGAGIARNSALLREEAERTLDRELGSAISDLEPLLRESDYVAALKRLATLRPTVDDFFDRVMVMVDDDNLRNNRLALLRDLGNLFLRVADVSRLQS